MRRSLTRSTAVAAASVLALSLLSPSQALADDNRPPDRPDTATLTARGRVCSTDRDAPTLIGSTAPLLRGVFRDPDSETGAQRIRAEFEWALDGTDELLGAAESTSTWHHPGRDPYPLSVTASGLPEDTLMRYRARGHDDHEPGEWSEWCWIEANTDGPEAPPRVTSDDYLPNGGFQGAPGRTAEFTFANNGTLDAVSYEYNLGLEPLCNTRVELDEPGASATVSITPQRSGPQWIYARSVDAYGNTSACESVYEVLVAPLADPVAYFPLDEGEGANASDVLTLDRTATGSGDVAWTRGRVGERQGEDYRLEGAAVATAEGHLRTDGPLLDTSTAFTVSAWVRLDETGTDAVALSQDGENLSGFQLGYDASEEAWVFQTASQDGPETGFDHRVVSTVPVQTGVWTQLNGQYDPAAGEIALYVEGAHQGSAAWDSAWNAGGPFVIGGGREAGAFSDTWPGAVDDVKVWDRLLINEDKPYTDTKRSEVWQHANLPLALEGRWRLDEAEGAAAADSSDRGIDATLHGDPATVWGGAPEGWYFDTGVLLDGSDQEHLRTDGPAVRTDRSFTAAAWVWLDDTGSDAVALSQSGEHTSGFALGYDAELKAWVFETSAGDSEGAEVSRAASAWAQAGRWTHLIGVYDHVDATLALYVDGIRQEDAEREGVWQADGDVVIGGAWHADGVDRSWTGALSTAHLFQGVALDHDVTLIEMGFLP
ncbi:LamG domain-containing protein [Nocardiopsis dassonvillei]|uniref:LamG domain-containing protein n=1 Tax=Nocardiopsis dassonvillei TaxID=2014 RepID=UPI0020A3670B|nr:LamG domain-containing protein [Nocardiopsis dassonvillei]MCP3012817.1 LamG domain-containing protein [Nocardiopsis dassonvillei]